MISLNKTIGSNRSSLWRSLQQFTETCRHHCDRWIRQNIIDEDPYDADEQELALQRMLQDVEHRLLAQADSEPLDRSGASVAPSPDLPQWDRAEFLRKLYLDLETASKPV
ncbi:hypothetical protein [Altericista sp. CCNU0014]|uniref:hypothetical protein n=1 Tax=Altericista sp. CCNU0014 TaxID=3082949 RepID=UPI00384C65B7